MNEGRKDTKGKPIMGAIPPNAEREVAHVLTFGAKKYGRDNWRLVDDWEVVYTDAALRHINDDRRGIKRDPESGRHPLAHAICDLMFKLEKELTSKVREDNINSSPKIEGVEVTEVIEDVEDMVVDKKYLVVKQSYSGEFLVGHTVYRNEEGHIVNHTVGKGCTDFIKNSTMGWQIVQKDS